MTTLAAWKTLVANARATAPRIRPATNADADPGTAVRLAREGGITRTEGVYGAAAVASIDADVRRDVDRARREYAATVCEVVPGAHVPDRDSWVRALLALAAATANGEVWDDLVRPRLAPAAVTVVEEAGEVTVAGSLAGARVAEAVVALPVARHVAVRDALEAEAALLAAVRRVAAAVLAAHGKGAAA